MKLDGVGVVGVHHVDAATGASAGMELGLESARQTAF